MKKTLSLLLAVAMLIGMCSAALAEAPAYKIGIMTSTVSQNEEEFRGAEFELNRDPDHIITDTYPDSFMAEQETTVSKLVAMASDPEVKAIIMAQAVPGCVPGFSKIREMRDDILLIACVPQEDPLTVSNAADLIMMADEVNMADTIMQKCVEWGIDVLIHYSFPRHMAIEHIVGRHILLEQNCAALGIELADVTAPDPTAEAGPTASQQFMFEDVPAQMEKYAGKKVAFFTTNCSMQAPLQTAVLAAGPDAYYPSPCCPSPYHGFYSTLSLKPDYAAGNEAALKTVAEKLNETNSAGRFSTWESPIVITAIEVGTAYAKAYINGEITEKNDQAALLKLLNDRIPGAQIRNYVNAEGTTLSNFYTIMLTPINFEDYL